MESESDSVEPVISPNTVKVVAECNGFGNVTEAALRDIADELTFRLKEIAQDAKKFMENGKRRQLVIGDIDRALKVKSFEPHYGFSALDFVPFCYSSGHGSREIFFGDEKELNLEQIAQASPLKAPLDITLKGVQPAIPENPVEVSEKNGQFPSTSGQGSKRFPTRELATMKTIESHELSIEQHLYFKEVTEACVGSEEPKRLQALNNLSVDTGIQPLLPRIIVFIVEGIRCNTVTHNLALLIYLCRMVKCLLDNPAVCLDKHLHDLLPGILSCVVGRQLCPRPDVDNHWALRDFAARVLALLCKKHAKSVRDLQPRVVNVLLRTLRNERGSLATWYGALTEFSELGPEAVKLFVIPMIHFIGARLKKHAEHSGPTSAAEKASIEHIKTLMQKMLVTYAKFHLLPRIDSSCVNIEERFVQELGEFFGPLIFSNLSESGALKPGAIVTLHPLSISTATDGFLAPSPVVTPKFSASLSGNFSLSRPSSPGLSKLSGGAAPSSSTVGFSSTASVLNQRLLTIKTEGQPGPTGSTNYSMQETTVQAATVRQGGTPNFSPANSATPSPRLSGFKDEPPFF